MLQSQVQAKGDQLEAVQFKEHATRIQLESLQSHSTDILSSREELKHQIRDMEMVMEKQRKAIAQLKGQLDDASTITRAAKQLQNKAMKRAEKADHEQKLAENRAAKAENVCERLTVELQSLKRELDDAKAEIKLIRAQRELALDRSERLREDLACANSEIDLVVANCLKD